MSDLAVLDAMLAPEPRGWINPDATPGHPPLTFAARYVDEVGPEALTEWCRARRASWVEGV